MVGRQPFALKNARQGAESAIARDPEVADCQHRYPNGISEFFTCKKMQHATESCAVGFRAWQPLKDEWKC